MDLVNIVYRYVNRFIDSEELINLLENIDKTKFSETELKEINELLQKIKEIVKTTPNEIDVVEEKRLENINRILESIKNIDNEKLDEKGREFLKKRYDSLLKDKEKKRDSGPRYKELFELLTHFPIYNKTCLQMNDLELLEFITQYISVPLPPPLSQENFEDLVEAGIKEDKRESIWRMAMNYNRRNIDFAKIEDYFILKRDDYYLAELISGVEEDLDLDRLIAKVLETKDVKFILKLANTPYLDPIFTDKQKEKVKNAINELKKGRSL